MLKHFPAFRQLSVHVFYCLKYSFLNKDKKEALKLNPIQVNNNINNNNFKVNSIDFRHNEESSHQ